jgi:mannose-1-phosphate guanylyltransferase/mannose-6-phosphate isomerase
VLVRNLEANGLVLVLASDHHIGDTAAFSAAVRRAIPAAMSGYICTFGVKPSSPETGFGYIKRTSEEVKPGCFRIDQFKEKPDLKTAQEYLADGRYDWNAGIFLFDASKMLSELSKHEPSIGPACEEAIAAGETDAWGSVRLNKAAFAKAKATSVDYAVMERTEMSAVIQLDAAWTDVGSWPSVFQTCVGKPTNIPGNKDLNIYTHGHVHHSEVKNSFLSTDGPLLAAIGVQDICVIATEDAVLVLPMEAASAQAVGAMAKRLNLDPKTRGLTLNHLSASTPWGSQKELDRGANHRLVRLTIKPGCATPGLASAVPIQLTVAEGTGTLSCGNEDIVLTGRQSHDVPAGTTYHLKNTGSLHSPNLVVLELQGQRGDQKKLAQLQPAQLAQPSPCRIQGGVICVLALAAVLASSILTSKLTKGVAA